MSETTKIPKDYISVSHHLKLTFLEALNHYFIVVVLILLGFLPAYDVIIYALNGDEAKAVVFNESLTLSLFWFCAAIAFIYIQRRQLTFRKFIGTATDEELNQAFERTAKLHQWKQKKIKPNFYRAYHEDWFSPMKGEMITVLKINNEIWINSVCDLKSWSSVSSLGWNMHNVKLFFHHLNAVKAGRPVLPGEGPALKKKASRKLAKRIITYPVAILMVVIGVYYFFHGIGAFRNFIAAALILFPIAYILVDLKALNKKKKPIDS